MRNFGTDIFSPVGGHHFRHEEWGEYHMGAPHICIRLNKLFNGIDAIHTTGGEAMWVPHSSDLLFFDRTIILLFNYEQSCVWHIDRPRRRLFFLDPHLGEHRLEVDVVRGSIWERVCDHWSVSLPGDPRFKDGLGAASQGLTPSIDKLVVQAAISNRGMG